LEAFPKYAEARPCVSNNSQDQVWEISRVSSATTKALFKISCNTVSEGWKVLEAFPHEGRIQVTSERSESKDQLFYFEPAGNESVYILCDTENEGKRAMEAFPRDNIVKPSIFSSTNTDQKWVFEKH
jgi:hypothetical protein